MGQALVTVAQDAFVASMAVTSVAGSVIAFAGVLVAVIWMPRRPSDHVSLAPAPSATVDGLDLPGDQERGERRRQGAGSDAQPDGALQ